MTLETIFGDFEDLPEVAQRTWATSNARSFKTATGLIGPAQGEMQAYEGCMPKMGYIVIVPGV